MPKRPAYGPGSGEGRVIDRCESCGLGVLSGREIDLADSFPAQGEVEGPNRSSLQAAISARGWALIEPERRLYPTPQSAEPIAHKLGARVTRAGTPPRWTAVVAMWQTLVNAFTLGTNVLTDTRRGQQSPASGRERAAMTLDLVVTALVAIPLLLIALPLELLASAIGRGGITRFSLER